MKEIQIGRRYQHYRNQQLYRIIGLARHSETLEEMVIYQALYDCEKFGSNTIWARPKSLFLETVLYDGKMVSRFAEVTE
ncbi:MAG TPA: DUF1653 domain-containing protein [Coxiellaceae bacterium]|nr:DUF1653 domain-containing protein [Coxiellaceae bacterium]